MHTPTDEEIAAQTESLNQSMDGLMATALKCKRDRDNAVSENQFLHRRRGELVIEHDHAYDALRQIAVLAEYGTSGPDTMPRCKADKLSAEQATSLRGSISEIARAALGRNA